MESVYRLTPKQVAVMRVLADGVTELSATEVAVNARLLPDQVETALSGLERLGLVNCWYPVTGRTGEHLAALTAEGRSVLYGLAQFRGTPPIGMIVQVPNAFPAFSGWLGSRRHGSRVEVALDEPER